MAFPSHDKYWVDTTEFVEAHLLDKEALVAPREFGPRFPGRMVAYYSIRDTEIPVQWAVIHKGMIDQLDQGFLTRIIKAFAPVFANEVFVVFSSRNDIPRVRDSSPHLQSFWEKMRSRGLEKELRARDEKKDPFTSGLYYQNKITKLPLLHRILKARGRMKSLSKKLNKQRIDKVDYGSLSVDEIRRRMDERYWKKEAYGFACLQDKVVAEEVTKQIVQLISPTTDKRILEIGCGIGGMAPCISECQEYIGTDLSDEAISQAAAAFLHRPNFRFVCMDAMNLNFEDLSFDIVIAREVVEHLGEPHRAVREAFRVLKSGGTFVMTSPNRDSLHLRVNRMLGHEDFKCCFDHIREFAFREAVEILTIEGFTIKETRGVFLLPYWGIPGIDKHVRHLTDNDPRMVEMLRDLGERAGAEYSFLYVILAKKPAKVKVD